MIEWLHFRGLAQKKFRPVYYSGTVYHRIVILSHWQLEQCLDSIVHGMAGSLFYIINITKIIPVNLFDSFLVDAII